MSDYEAVCILKPNLSEEAVDTMAVKFEKIIVSSGGRVIKTDKFRSRLATKFDKFKEAFYIISEFKGNGKTVEELKRSFKISEEVIRHMIVRLKENPARIDTNKNTAKENA